MKKAEFNALQRNFVSMISGALLDNGFDADALTKGLSVLPLSGWCINAQKVNRGGLQVTHVNIDNGIGAAAAALRILSGTGEKL